MKIVSATLAVIILIFLILLFLVLTNSPILFPTAHVTVVIRNEGREALRSVRLHVTGNSYAVGDIKAGNAKSVKVCARGESSIKIEHNNKKFSIGTYLDNGYKGKITISMTPIKVLAVKDTIRPEAFTTCRR